MFIRNSLFILMLLSWCIISCKHPVTGNGNIISDERTPENFESVDLLGAAEVEIIQGNVYKVVVKSDENIVPLVGTKVNDRKLTISTVDEINLAHSKISIQITCPSINSANISGAGDLIINSFHQPNIKVSVHGAGNVKFANSECDTVYATLSGAGNMYVNAKNYLEATVNGVGNIEYSGDPTVKSKVSGVGNVSQKK
ncbi:MAG: DUF2807 domain-containing protein [Chitinophagales bacterium]